MLLNPPSASLARALLMLARSSKTGELRLQGAGKRASLGIVEGSVRAISIDAEGPKLLELLKKEDGLAMSLELNELRLREGELLGRRLVEGGYANAATVSYALRRQLALRMAAIFRWGAIELSFIDGLEEFEAPLILEAPSTQELILGALRSAGEEAPVHLLRRRIGDGVLKLTSFGAMLLDGAPLYPEEAALLVGLRRGAPAGELLAQAKGRVRAIRTLAGLLLIGAAEPPSPGAATYATLVRKRAQLRRGELPERLLDLNLDLNEEGRKDGARATKARASLRSILREIHPDRLASTAPPPVQRASTEIVAALLKAEAELEDRRGFGGSGLGEN